MLPFVPTFVATVDIDHPLPSLPLKNEPDLVAYSRALILVRLHTHPLGLLELDIPQAGLDSAELAERIWGSLESQIRDHLGQDGILQTEPLGSTGLQISHTPLCLQQRDVLLASAPFVSVVIATRDRVASLKECMHSILALDYPNYNVIVVDNAPQSAETADFIRTTFANSGKVRYLREDVPGLAIAHNRALTEVKAPIVAFTDDDVIVDSNWLKSIVENFQQDPQIGCVTGMILPYELETPPQLWIEQFGGFGKGYKPQTFDMQENRPQDFLFPYSAGKFGSGANMAFRTSVLTAIGGFDPALGAGTLAKGGDDLAAFFDVITHGYRLRYEPRAILSHKHRRDYPGLARQAYGYGVGLSAFLMKTIVDKPARLVDVIFKIPAGLKHILDPNSPKNQKKQADYPHELTRLERKGFLVGPLAYLRSRWKTHSFKKQLPVIPADTA
jgi:GT2 family glycosyltransferase